MTLLLGLLLSSAAAPADPPACAAYRSLIDEVGQLGPNFVMLRPGEVVTIGDEGRQLLRVREQMATAMQADDPDLALIEGLMRRELQLRATIGNRVAESDLKCKMAVLRTLDRAKLKENLEVLRPRTRAEIATMKNRVGLAAPPRPPAPPAPPTAPR